MQGRWTVSPRTYRKMAVVALAMLCIIVVTGALVRLTGSGLGCVDWPACNQERFIDVSSTHGAIEQVNRLFTGVVALSVIVAVLGSMRRSPRRRDLTWLSWGLVAGVLAQVVLGGVVVLTGLHPLANMGHFLLSMVLVANGLVLVHRAGEDDVSRPPPTVSAPTRRLAWLVAGLTTVAVVTGTVVTGTGPHAGDEDAPRFGFDIGHVARVHGITVVVTLLAALGLAWRLRSRPRVDADAMRGPLELFIALGLLQGAIGYTQYFAGVPVGLVLVHIAGATAVFLAAVNLVLRAR